MSASPPSLPYLTDLTLRLAAGASKIPAGIRQQHATWLLAQQRDDGCFAGRDGGSDPYYTAFALRALWILDAIDETVGNSAAAFLRSRLAGRESVIDLVSLVFAAAICELSVGAVVIDDADTQWRDNLTALFESLRTDDGGFAKTPEGRAGSTYQTFLSVLAFQLIESEPIAPGRILDFLQTQSHPDGGYLEIRAAKRAGVDPTAAAIGTLKAMNVLDVLDVDQQTATIDFLADMQTDSGGLTANTRIPFADLLSTFTGMLTLSDLNATDQVSVDAARRYALSMQTGAGGFVGFELDDTADVEYTFYGIATLALCHSLQA